MTIFRFIEKSTGLTAKCAIQLASKERIVLSQLRQRFFLIFERESWWIFRVSTPFSFLWLIRLTHFHENVKFRANMLKYLNTRFTFFKQTNDTFMKVQCRRTHSFIS